MELPAAEWMIKPGLVVVVLWEGWKQDRRLRQRHGRLRRDSNRDWHWQGEDWQTQQPLYWLPGAVLLVARNRKGKILRLWLMQRSEERREDLTALADAGQHAARGVARLAVMLFQRNRKALNSVPGTAHHEKACRFQNTLFQVRLSKYRRIDGASSSRISGLRFSARLKAARRFPSESARTTAQRAHPWLQTD